jgi:hypothetical protein
MSKNKGKTAKQKADRRTGYLLTHDQLGVLLGFMEIPGEEEGEMQRIPMFSNFESGGRGEALILWSDMPLLVILDEIKNQLREFGPEGFTLTPIHCRKGKLFLPMHKCEKLGIPKWHDGMPRQYSDYTH